MTYATTNYYNIPTSESKSTDKLKLLVDAVKHIPEAGFENLKTFELSWDELSGGTIVPVIKIEYK